METLWAWLRSVFLSHPERPGLIKDEQNAKPFEAWINGYHQRLRNSRERNKVL